MEPKNKNKKVERERERARTSKSIFNIALEEHVNSGINCREEGRVRKAKEHRAEEIQVDTLMEARKLWEH